MKNLMLFGGSGGIGSRLQVSLMPRGNWKIISLSSKDCDCRDIFNVEDIFSQYSPDAIIYLSGVNIDGLIHKQGSASIQRQIDVNALGFVNVLHAATMYMREQNWGRVIYISSVLSAKPIPGTGIYAATKAFCDNLIKTYALENAKYGITANSIQLGYFEGGLTEKVPPNIMEEVLKKVPAKRLGKSAELARMIEMILENDFINGANIPLTSGLENV